MSKREIPSDFEKQWERRRQALENAAQTAPDEDRMRLWVKLARQQQPTHVENEAVMRNGKLRWLPYAAAAACVTVLVGGGIRIFHAQTPALPEAEMVNLDGKQVYFLCNNSCSAAEVVQAAEEMFDK